jgi:hypothetical protein
MSQPTSLLVAALVGAAATAAAFVVMRERDATLAAPPAAAPDSGTASLATATPGAQPEALSPSFAAIAARVESLHDALRGIDSKLDAVLAARTAAGPANGGGVTVDPAMLETALVAATAKAERAKLDAMKPGEVIKAAEQLVNTRSDLGRAREMLESLLQRSLTPEERQQASVQLGIAHRSSGDFAAAQQVLQHAIDLAGGIDVESGAWAAFQLAWNHQFGNDLVNAREWFQKVGRGASGNQALRIEGMWNAAKLGDANDPRTRSELEAVLRECANQDAYRHIIADVKARLGAK